MGTRGIGKLAATAAITCAIGLTNGCGLEVEITDDPDPGIVGLPVKYTVDVKFVDSGTSRGSSLLLMFMPGLKGTCASLAEIERTDLPGDLTLAKIEEVVPEEVLSALPDGVSPEILAARLGGAVRAASAQSQATCEKVGGNPEDNEIDPFGTSVFTCMLGDIPNGQTETAMLEVVPSRPGVITTLAIAVGCESVPCDGEGGGAAGGPDDELSMCDEGIPSFAGVACEETVVQGGFGVPVASSAGLAVLAAALGVLGIVSRRR